MNTKERLVQRIRMPVTILWAGTTVVALTLGLGCRSDTSVTAPGVPTTAPYMSGRITSLSAANATSGTLRIESNPQSANQGLKAVAIVDGLTIVQLPGGKMGDFRAFTIGQWVRLWFDGAITQSYPVQGTANAIVIDSASVTLNGEPSQSR